MLREVRLSSPKVTSETRGLSKERLQSEKLLFLAVSNSADSLRSTLKFRRILLSKFRTVRGGKSSDFSS